MPVRRTLLAAAFVAAAIPIAAAQRPQRIISIIPAVTEMLFAIGAGPQVVAVGSFDEYPPEVQKLERVGALLDPDLERILALKPDLVIVYTSQTDLQKQLDRAGVSTFRYEHGRLDDVMSTIRALGARVGHREEAERTARDIESELAALSRKLAGQPRPKTLLVIGRDASALRGIYASGGVGFLHDMLTIAGGDNVFADVPRQSVQATTELILARRPEVIIELRAGEIPADDKKKEIDSWKVLASVPAVRDGRVFLLTDQRTVVPGPRIAQGTELLARVLHPDAFK
jgi:iron complex transport system substrate-binding protein